jgi:uncharacterized protein YerC
MIQNLKAKRDEIVAGGVALSAFAASAQHIFHVTAAAGNPDVVAALHPAGIDGLIYIGIRAMQQGNKKAGGLAIAYGAGYSLAFNAASYGGFVMPVWALAACMPLAMFLAFLIVHGGHKMVQAAVETVEVVREVQVLPQLLPIAPLAPKVQAPALPVAVAKSRTRAAGWDVEKAVAMILDGKTDAEIMEVVAGIGNVKTLQRNRRVVKLISSGMTPEDIKAEVTPPMSLAHITRVHAAMADMS